MRDIRRIPNVLELIGKEWIKHPDQRFFQLVINVGREMGYDDPFYVEDDELIDHLNSHLTDSDGSGIL